MKRMILLLIFIGSQFLITDMHASDELLKIVENEQANYPQGDLLSVEYVQQILEYMYQVDQAIRVEFLQDAQNGGDHKDEFVSLMHKAALFHVEKMKEILAVHGWINISRFGAVADNQAWLLIQDDACDPFFQAGCLFVLTSLVDRGETNAVNYAFFYDRVALKFLVLGVQQKYGTQFMMSTDGELQLCPCDGTLQDIAQLQEKMGVVPVMAQYMEFLRTIYKK